jgi:hypothetical protein
MVPSAERYQPSACQEYSNKSAKHEACLQDDPEEQAAEQYAQDITSIASTRKG